MAEILRADRWEFEANGESELCIPFKSKQRPWTLKVTQRGHQLHSVARCPEQARKRPDMAGFLNRLNARLDLGSFELDYLHGDISLRTTLDMGEGKPSPPLLRPLLDHPPRTLELALPALTKVAQGASSELPEFPAPEPGKRKSPLLDQLGTFLREAGQSPTRRDEKLVLHVVGERARWRCEVAMVGTVCRFLSRAPVTIPPRSQPAVLEFLTRVNAALRLGNFQLERSEVRYRTSFDAGLGPLPEPVLWPMLQASLTALDQWLPGFLSVIYGQETPQAALKRLK